MGTHWYIKDGKGGVNPTVLAKPKAVYVKRFWEAELKKQDKKTSSLAVASAQNLKSRTPLVTPKKKPKKVMKKVEFVPLSSIKTRSKSRSLTKHKVTTPQTKRKSSPKIQTSKA